MGTGRRLLCGELRAGWKEIAYQVGGFAVDDELLLLEILLNSTTAKSLAKNILHIIAPLQQQTAKQRGVPLAM